ncbi:hypothetical protein FEF26_07860 [Nesterenkonia salmonea]|uniref:Uncharacterized protein n=1 Tax=Nesterenkonia salmonea TaxID=1804987 RepID=A0A5R9BC80_9MICC|nr:hypothetical protein [Nesterenkonia salmonea]TLP97361.1 hypothetical protein FEF26_07860 [Nesterenkonia salmonea]
MHRFDPGDTRYILSGAEALENCLAAAGIDNPEVEILLWEILLVVTDNQCSTYGVVTQHYTEMAGINDWQDRGVDYPTQDHAIRMLASDAVDYAAGNPPPLDSTGPEAMSEWAMAGVEKLDGFYGWILDHFHEIACGSDHFDAYQLSEHEPLLEAVSRLDESGYKPGALSPHAPASGGATALQGSHSMRAEIVELITKGHDDKKISLLTGASSEEITRVREETEGSHE